MNAAVVAATEIAALHPLHHVRTNGRTVSGQVVRLRCLRRQRGTNERSNVKCKEINENLFIMSTRIFKCGKMLLRYCNAMLTNDNRHHEQHQHHQNTLQRLLLLLDSPLFWSVVVCIAGCSYNIHFVDMIYKLATPCLPTNQPACLTVCNMPK